MNYFKHSNCFDFLVFWTSNNLRTLLHFESLNCCILKASALYKFRTLYLYVFDCYICRALQPINVSQFFIKGDEYYSNRFSQDTHLDSSTHFSRRAQAYTIIKKMRRYSRIKYSNSIYYAHLWLDDNDEVLIFRPCKITIIASVLAITFNCSSNYIINFRISNSK